MNATICTQCGYSYGGAGSFLQAFFGRVSNCPQCGAQNKINPTQVINPPKPSAYAQATKNLYPCMSCGNVVNLQSNQICQSCQYQKQMFNMQMGQGQPATATCGICGKPGAKMCAACIQKWASNRPANQIFSSSAIWRQNWYTIIPDDLEEEKEPDEWEQLITRARDKGLTQEDIELALALKESGLTRADIAIMTALKERLHG